MTHCNLCGHDKPLDQFHLRYDGTKPQPYCKDCKGFWNGMRKMVDGRLVAPSMTEVRAALTAIGGAPATPAAPALKLAGHTRAPREVRVEVSADIQAARQVLRDAEAKAKQSSQGPQGFIYCVGESFGGGAVGGEFDSGWLINSLAVKVGYSDQPDGWRISGLQTGNPRVLLMLGTLRDKTKADEQALHAKLIEHNVLQEWFRPVPEVLSEFGLEARVVGNGCTWVARKGA